MSLYHDPSLPYLRPSLVGDLLGVPATKSQHQLENQATAVVAWLVDRSPALARIVLELFFYATTRLTKGRLERGRY